MTFVRLLAPVLLTAQLGSVNIFAGEQTSATFDSKGTRIHYVTAGSGAPVVLIHGLHSSAELNWQKPGIVGELAREFRVVAVDLPGHGRSDKPEKAEAYGLQVVEDIVLLLDHLKIKKAHVVGYSLGGMVAAKLAATYPERVLSLTLGGMGWLREGSALQKVWEKLPTRDAARTPAVFVQNMGKYALSEDELKRIAVPVKVIVGDRDPVKKLYVVPLQRVRSDWPVVEIPDAGHINCIVKVEFREELVRWLRQKSK